MKVEDYYSKLITSINNTSKEQIKTAIQLIKTAVENQRWIYTCGNGGSALTASHYVTDWAKMRMVNRGHSFKAMCLADNLGLVTAYANDISYQNCFDFSVSNYAEKGDILIAISGSGNSQNVLNAVRKAKELNVLTIGIVGFDGGKLLQTCDHAVHYPINDMQICEDLHLSFGHIVMKELCDPC